MSLARSRMVKSSMRSFFRAMASAMPPKPQPMMRMGTWTFCWVVVPVIVSRSLRFDFRLLGHAAVELIVALDLVAKRFRRATDQLEVALAQELLDLVFGQHLVERLVQLHDDVARRLARHHDALPADQLKTRNGLTNRWNILEVAGRAALAGDGNGAQPAVLHR